MHWSCQQLQFICHFHHLHLRSTHVLDHKTFSLSSLLTRLLLLYPLQRHLSLFPPSSPTWVNLHYRSCASLQQSLRRHFSPLFIWSVLFLLFKVCFSLQFIIKLCLKALLNFIFCECWLCLVNFLFGCTY